MAFAALPDLMISAQCALESDKAVAIAVQRNRAGPSDVRRVTVSSDEVAGARVDENAVASDPGQ